MTAWHSDRQLETGLEAQEGRPTTHAITTDGTSVVCILLLGARPNNVDDVWTHIAYAACGVEYSMEMHIVGTSYGSLFLSSMHAGYLIRRAAGLNTSSLSARFGDGGGEHLREARE